MNLKNNFLGRTVTSVSEEKTLNPRLTKPREDFIKIMNELGLPYPKKIGKIFFHILIWQLFIWDTLEIKYRMSNPKIWQNSNAESTKIGHNF